MKVRHTGLLLLGLILMAGPVYAQAEPDEGRPAMGIGLDPRGLSDLLVKHLRLSPGQGIRVKNVVAGSPADKAGLERDDIIIQFEGRKVEDNEEFVNAVREAGIGAEVELGIIHLGERKDVTLELEALSWDNVDWKYPAEPEAVESWMPGRLFRFQPGQDDWIEIPFEKFPDADVNIHKFFKELYTYQHVDDSGGYSITIEGDPADEDTRVIVRKDNTEYNTTVKHLDDLPKEYQKPAKHALQNAARSRKQRDRITKFKLPSPPEPKIYKRYFEDLRPQFDRKSDKTDKLMEQLQKELGRLQKTDKKDDLIERIEKQLDKLQERMEQLERRLSEIPRKLRDRDEDSSDPSGDAGADDGAV